MQTPLNYSICHPLTLYLLFWQKKKVKNEDPGIYFKYLDCECVNVRSHVCGCDQLKKGPRARTSHTCFRVHFARTRTCATAHRTCACAHAPSQLIPRKFPFIETNLFALQNQYFVLMFNPKRKNHWLLQEVKMTFVTFGI